MLCLCDWCLSRSPINLFKAASRKNYKVVVATAKTAKKMFSIKDFISKCDQTCGFLRIWSHLLKKFLVLKKQKS